MELGFDPGRLLRLKPLQKTGIAAGILVVIAAGYWQLFFRELQTTIETLDGEIAKLEEGIQSRQSMLRKLPEMRKELAALKLQEAEAVRKLPSRKEIPALLTDISNAGHEQGLTFLLFAPKAELLSDIHAEVPVEMQLQGNFHETALFMQTIARMPRIVTIHDIVMAPDKTGPLLTTAKATTYRFLDADEMAAQAQKKLKNAKAGNKGADKNKKDDLNP
ncbi:MAG: type 4a pilus biogenesis protein PilO [Magnetococcales bacterium]|nr:type 4a pilus biogenesis protein PilO [Magnetococcales bacterium]